MTSLRFHLTALLVSALVRQSPFNWKVFRGKINPVLICVCSCPVVTLPHRASTAVNVKTLLGRLCKGAGGDGYGCKGRVCMLPVTHIYTRQACHSGGKVTVLAWVTTNICYAVVPKSKIQLHRRCPVMWTSPLALYNFPSGINRWTYKHTSYKIKKQSIDKFSVWKKPWAGTHTLVFT